MGEIDSPLVFQCASCRTVITDSNQLVCTVEALDALIVDAVLGVTVSPPADSGSNSALQGSEFPADCITCDACSAPLGCQYSTAPAAVPAALAEQVVWRQLAPRYALRRHALAAYALGTAGLHHNHALGLSSDGLQAAQAVGAPEDARWQETRCSPDTGAELVALAARVKAIEAACMPSGGGGGGSGGRDDAARARIKDLTTSLLALEARLQALEDGREDKRARCG